MKMITIKRETGKTLLAALAAAEIPLEAATRSATTMKVRQRFEKPLKRIQKATRELKAAMGI